MMQKVNVDNTKFSVDLQKVVMIPRMPGCKTVAFTRRIIAFNETFAPLGSKNTLKNKDIACAITWHEGITKRNGEDIASAFIKWLSMYGIREKTNITLWLDNKPMISEIVEDPHDYSGRLILTKISEKLNSSKQNSLSSPRKEYGLCSKLFR